MGATQTDWQGGHAQALTLARTLRREGYRVAVVCHRSSQLHECLKQDALDVRTVLGRGLNPVAVWQLRRHLVAFRPDIIHAFDTGFLRSAFLASRGLRTPGNLLTRDASSVRSGRWLERLHCDRVLCTNASILEDRRRAGIPARKLVLAPDFFAPSLPMRVPCSAADSPFAHDTSPDSPHALALLDDSLRTLRRTLKAFQQVRDYFRGATLQVVGLGTQNLSEAGQALEQLQLQDSVQLVASIDPAAELTRRADYLLLPGNLADGRRLLVEAMGHGTRIVALSCSTYDDLLTPLAGREVAWMTQADVESFTRTWLQALTARDESLRRARWARARADAMLSEDALWETMQCTYQEVIERSLAKRQASQETPRISWPALLPSGRLTVRWPRRFSWKRSPRISS